MFAFNTSLIKADGVSTTASRLNRLCSLGRMLAFTLVAGIALSASAMGQTQVQDVDNEVRNFSMVIRATCTSVNGVCAITSAPVPNQVTSTANKRLLIKRVSAQITTSSGAILQSSGAPTFTGAIGISVTSHGYTNVTPGAYFPITTNPINNNQQLIYVVNEPIYLGVNAGDAVEVKFTSSSTTQPFTVAVVVTGVLVTL